MTRPRARKMISVPKRVRREPPQYRRYHRVPTPHGDLWMREELLPPDLQARLDALRSGQTTGTAEVWMQLMTDIDAERAARKDL